MYNISWQSLEDFMDWKEKMDEERPRKLDYAFAGVWYLFFLLWQKGLITSEEIASIWLSDKEREMIDMDAEMVDILTPPPILRPEVVQWRQDTQFTHSAPEPNPDAE